MTSPIGNHYRAIPAGVNIQIFNAGPCLHEPCPHCEASYMSNPYYYPASYYTNGYETRQQVINQNQAVNNNITNINSGYPEKSNTTEDKTNKASEKAQENTEASNIDSRNHSETSEISTKTTNTDIKINKTLIETKEAEKTSVIKELGAIQEEPQKKTVKLTDEYIKALESYLNSQDVEKRLMAAKEILERVQEDETRKDNLALTALTNKMLKDPHQPIRFLALGILEDRLITGNAETIDILHKVETGRYSQYGNVDQDAIKASNVLLKMVRKTEEE